MSARALRHIVQEHRDRPINPPAVSEIMDGAVFRLGAHGGISTYSPNWNYDSEDLNSAGTPMRFPVMAPTCVFRGIAFEQSPLALFWRLRQCFETLLVQSGKPAA
jgi:hypothetical protein